MKALWRGGGIWCAVAVCGCIAASAASAASLSGKAKEEGCTGKPTVVQGTGLYRCPTQNGVHYFNIPAGASGPSDAGGGGGSAAIARSAPTPSTFPKVDAATQKGRDDVRRKVLTEELATEQKLLDEARAAYANGAPPPTSEEKNMPQRYAERVVRLKQAVSLHEKNIEALQKELAAKR